MDMNVYAIVKLGKEISGFKSDRAFAMSCGLTAQNIADWKFERAMPSWENLERLARACNMEVWEAVKYMQEHDEIYNLQAGFANRALLASISAGSVGALTLSAMSPIAGAATGAALFGVSLLSIHYAKSS